MTSRIAVVQAGSLLFDTSGTLAHARAWIASAAAEDARLVVFPEAFLGGYPKGMDFGVKVGIRTPAGRREFRRYWESAITVPGPELQEVAASAVEHGVYVVMGCVERDGGSLYCSVVYLGPDGALLGKHRKVMPTAMERLIWGFGDGSTLPVITTDLGRLGAVICWENYMPLLRTAMYQQQVQLYCACTVDDRESWLPTMRHIAIEGRCFVLSACQHVPGLIRGGSVVVNPFGELLAGPVYGEDTVLCADLDLGQIAEGKFDLDVAGHYARPDIFQLTVNRTVQTPASVPATDVPATDDCETQRAAKRRRAGPTND